ncbi:DNA-processing protein DprA [Desulfolithobacter sp.]
MRSDLLDWLSLALVPGLGPALTGRLLDRFKTPRNIFDAPPDAFRSIAGLGPKIIARLQDPALLSRIHGMARDQLACLARTGITVLTCQDPEFPDRLLHIHDPPLLLFCQGRLEMLRRPAVAVVGSRAATSYGERVARELGRELADHGIVVLSGMAFGIDGAAHWGALESSGLAVGVLGCGIDVVYPRQHEALFSEVGRRGLLVSEYGPGICPARFRFPARNRIVSGLSLGVVVVEAGSRSGALITARLALEQGREVFAVPGRVDSFRSRGTHELLRQGATLVGSVDDILDELRFVVNGSVAQGKGERSGVPQVDTEEVGRDGLSADEVRVLAALDTYPCDIDSLARAVQMEPARLHGILLKLEISGRVRQLPGQQYERTGKGAWEAEG